MVGMIAKDYWSLQLGGGIYAANNYTIITINYASLDVIKLLDNLFRN